MTQHTPGPWRVDLNQYDNEYRVYQVDGPPIVNALFHSSVTAKANACLIAAAPDLLAGAVEAIAAWDMEEDTQEWNHEDRLENAVAMLRAAIAKAGA